MVRKLLDSLTDSRAVPVTRAVPIRMAGRTPSTILAAKRRPATSMASPAAASCAWAGQSRGTARGAGEAAGLVTAIPRRVENTEPAASSAPQLQQLSATLRAIYLAPLRVLSTLSASHDCFPMLSGPSAAASCGALPFRGARPWLRSDRGEHFAACRLPLAACRILPTLSGPSQNGPRGASSRRLHPRSAGPAPGWRRRHVGRGPPVCASALAHAAPGSTLR
jgi:hypothetical protein